MTTTTQKEPKKQTDPRELLKREIRFWLKRVDNYEFLKAVRALIRNEGMVKRVAVLPDELVKKLEAAKRDIAEGRTIPHEEVMEGLRQRFGIGTPCEKIKNNKTN